MTATAAIRVLCVDDNADLSLLLQRQIDFQADMESVGRVHDLDDVLDAVARHRPNVIVLDFSMLGRDALGTMSEIQAAHPQVRILVYTGYDDAETIACAREAGAAGFAVKSHDIEELFESVRRVARGEQVFPVR